MNIILVYLAFVALLSLLAYLLKDDVASFFEDAIRIPLDKGLKNTNDNLTVYYKELFKEMKDGREKCVDSLKTKFFMLTICGIVANGFLLYISFEKFFPSDVEGFALAAAIGITCMEGLLGEFMLSAVYSKHGNAAKPENAENLINRAHPLANILVILFCLASFLVLVVAEGYFASARIAMVLEGYNLGVVQIYLERVSLFMGIGIPVAVAVGIFMSKDNLQNFTIGVFKITVPLAPFALFYTISSLLNFGDFILNFAVKIIQSAITLTGAPFAKLFKSLRKGNGK